MSHLPISTERGLAGVDPGPADGCLVSEYEYWRDCYDAADVGYEWNNGRLGEKPAYMDRDLVVNKAEYAAGGVPEYHISRFSRRASST